MAPLHCGSPIWLSGAAVFGTPLWSVSLGLGFGGVGGASPPCVGAPVCGWCVCGVDLVDTLPYCSPYCGALPSTSRVFSPLASSSLSLFLTPSPHPIQTPWLCGACYGTSPALHKCRPPQPTPPHTPLSSPRAVTHLMCCVSLLVCVCSVHTARG